MKLYKLIFSTMLVALSTSAMAQHRVTGRVTDASGEALVNATVEVRGQNLKTLTNTDGSYTLSSPEREVEITASLLGYAEQTQAITLGTSMKQLNFTLEVEEQVLGDLVVIGYGTSYAKDLTGSVVNVTDKTFQKGSFATPEALMVGKTPGVRITSNSGQPGAGSRIRIRGGSSLNASNDPLVVIDGVPANGLGMLNPADIESFTILKDASATAIYGSRAANGVILVTTKKGTASGGVKVDFSMLGSVRQVGKTIDVLTPEQFVDAINERGTSSQINRLAEADGYSKVDGQIVIGDGAQYTDWQKEIYQTGMVQDMNVAIGGGIKGLPYRLSLGAYHETGILKTSDLKRYSMSLNMAPEFLGGRLIANTNIKLIRDQNRYANNYAIGTAVFFDPTRPVMSGNEAYGGYFEWLMPNGEPSALSPKNPVGMLNQRFDIGGGLRALGNVLLDYQPLASVDNWHVFMNLGGEFSSRRGTFVTPAEAAMDWYNGGGYREYESYNTNRLIELYTNYNHDLGATNLDWTAGYSFQGWRTTAPSYPSLSEDMQDTIYPANPFPHFTENALMSFYGRVKANVANKYLITATLRSDGSSRFSKESRWGLFPSAALGWNVLEEDLFADQTLFSSLKVRAGWGVTGQQDIYNDYGYIPNYSYGTLTAQYQFGTQWVDILRPDAYDYNLEWEKTATTNLAVDYGFMKNRINGTLDWYHKNTYDLLGVVPVPAGTNFSNQVLTNVGQMTNTGVEASLNLVLVETQDTEWDVNFNASTNRNEIVKLNLVQDSTNPGILVGGIAGGVGNTIQIHAIGAPMYSYYAYVQRYDDAGRPLERNGDLSSYVGNVDTDGNGRIDFYEAYVDQNGDGIINSSDLVLHGGMTPEPRQMYAFSTNFRHKRWSGGMTWRAETGQFVYNNVNSTHGNYFDVGGSMKHLNNLTANYLHSKFRTPQYLSDYYIESADYVRLDNVYLSYDLGNLFKESMPAQLNFSVQNALVLTNYSGIDPEIAGGIDNMIYPRPRIFNIQLNVSL